MIGPLDHMRPPLDMRAHHTTTEPSATRIPTILRNMLRMASKTLFYLNDHDVGQILHPKEGRMFCVGANCFTITLADDNVLFLSKWTLNSDPTDVNVNHVLVHAQPLMIERDRFLYLAGPVPEADSDAVLHEVAHAVAHAVDPETSPSSLHLPSSPWFTPPSPPYFQQGSPSYCPESPPLISSSPSFTPESPASDQISRSSPPPALQLEPPHFLLTKEPESAFRPRSMAHCAADSNGPYRNQSKKRRVATLLGPKAKKAATSHQRGFTIGFVMKFSPWRL